MSIYYNRQLVGTAEDFSLSITAAGNALCSTSWQATELSPPYTRLYYILDGMGQIETIRGQLPLKKGCLYLLPVGYRFSHWCEHSMQQLYFHINVTNSHGTDILRGVDRVLFKELDPAHTKKLLALFETDSFVARSYLKSLLQADIFSLLTENGVCVQNRQLCAPIRAVLSFIEENLSAALSVQTVAEHMSIPVASLSGKFKAELGISLGKYIDSQVMHRAEDLLINTALPLAAISERLGFYDQFYFSRRFKQMYGISPLKYRKLHNAG